jgi:hypothetical protein
MSVTIETTPAGPLKTATVTAERVVGRRENGDAIREEFPVRISGDGDTFCIEVDGERAIEMPQESVEALLAAARG